MVSRKGRNAVLDTRYAVATIYVQHGAAAKNTCCADSEGVISVIDVENQVFNNVAKALRAEFKGIFVVSTDTDAPSSFPAVCFWEQSNVPCAKTQTAHSRENSAELMYQGGIYSNLVSGGKQQCRKIAAVIDREMTKMGFIRTFGQPVLNPADTSISRYVLRYKGIVDRDGYVYTS